MLHLIGDSYLSNPIQNLKHQIDRDKTREKLTTVRLLSVNSNTGKTYQTLINDNQVQTQTHCHLVRRDQQQHL